jgi:hypothetical protein
MTDRGRADLGRIGNGDELLVGGDVVGPAGAVGGVGGGIDSGEGAELVGEVGLVVVTAVKGELGPAYVDSDVELMNGALEALDAAPDFGREADCFAEDLGKATLAPADLPCGFANAGDVGDAFELTESEVDFCGTGRIAARDLCGEMAAQELLETEETSLRGWEIAESITKAVCLRSPDIKKRNALVAEQMS